MRVKMLRNVVSYVTLTLGSTHLKFAEFVRHILFLRLVPRFIPRFEHSAYSRKTHYSHPVSLYCIIAGKLYSRYL